MGGEEAEKVENVLQNQFKLQELVREVLMHISFYYTFKTDVLYKLLEFVAISCLAFLSPLLKEPIFMWSSDDCSLTGNLIFSIYPQ